MTNERAVMLCIHLNKTMPGALGGIQMGSAGSATVPKWVAMPGTDHTFHVSALLKDGRLPLRGPVIQKDGKGRFLYIVWRSVDGVVSRRAKLYVESITQVMVDSELPIRAEFPGLAKDGLPCCATVKPLEDWQAATP